MKVNKSKLFKVAHAIIRKGQAATLSDALKAAWKAVKIYTQMLGIVVFTFRKSNGEIRKAVGTLRNLNYQAKGGTNAHSKNEDVICYWDCKKNAFRSFKSISLI